MNAQYFSLYSVVLTVINLDAFMCQLFEHYLNLFEICTLVETKFSKLFVRVVFPNYKNHYSKEEIIIGNTHFVFCTHGIHLLEKMVHE